MADTEFPEEAARIEANVAYVLDALDCNARHLAARYSAPVYLVGSTLHHPNPRDCDIRVLVEDQEFAARYGMEWHQRETQAGTLLHKRGIVAARIVDFTNDGPTQRWIDDVAKFNSRISERAKLNMDIQIWPESMWREPFPAPILLAAPSPRRFIHNKYLPERSPSPDTRDND